MKKYHYIELCKGAAYVLYDAANGKDFSDPKSVLSIGDERTVKNAITKLQSDCVIMYYSLKDVKLAKDGSVFEIAFKTYLTKNFVVYKPKNKPENKPE